MLQSTAIAQVYLEKLPILGAEGGAVLPLYKPGTAMHSYLEEKKIHLVEIYFSEIEAHAVKAWKRHRLQQGLFCVPRGLLRLVLYDTRPKSPTYGRVASFSLGRPDKYCVLTMPPMIWYGLACEGETPALLCNCIDRPHDPKECETLPKDTDQIPYSFSNISQ
ncbi:MAG: dTDP-4-dehydrorhamnose 3,5-epimerase family protein [Desulfovibrionaceae bacterium]|nr:dTDP-4-dehydrorhamnose 3,5-epimerase family protein [Desulfovibrionaceae bacterium]